MVLPLRPSKFYGSSLPRPRVYSDLKFNSERVDPPMGVTAPLLSWAKDAHWSMGGLLYQKKRMAGKIEGSKKRLRDEPENGNRKQIKAAKKRKLLQEEGEKESNGTKLQEDFESPKSEVKPDEDLKSPKSKQIKAAKKRKLLQEEGEKESNGTKLHEGFESPKSEGKSQEVLETPKSKVFSKSESKVFSSPRPAQIFKSKWATDEDNEDCTLVVQDSIKRHAKKRSPKVQIRSRNSGNSSEGVSKGARFTKGVSSIVEQKCSRAHSVVQYALKRQATGITHVYDYVPVPDKTFKRVSPRRKKENKEGADSGLLAGLEPRSPDSTERSTRCSSRVLSYSPGPFSRRLKRVILSP